MADDCLRIGNMLIKRVIDVPSKYAPPLATDFSFLFLDKDGNEQNLGGMLDSVTIRFDKNNAVRVEIETSPRPYKQP